ncbi:hypothetical protein JCM10212_006524, partial [Sporobolomyces blumeae]
RAVKDAFNRTELFIVPTLEDPFNLSDEGIAEAAAKIHWRATVTTAMQEADDAIAARTRRLRFDARIETCVPRAGDGEDAPLNIASFPPDRVVVLTRDTDAVFLLDPAHVRYVVLELVHKGHRSYRVVDLVELAQRWVLDGFDAKCAAMLFCSKERSAGVDGLGLPRFLKKLAYVCLANNITNLVAAVEHFSLDPPDGLVPLPIKVWAFDSPKPFESLEDLDRAFRRVFPPGAKLPFNLRTFVSLFKFANGNGDPPPLVSKKRTLASLIDDHIQKADTWRPVEPLPRHAPPPADASLGPLPRVTRRKVAPEPWSPKFGEWRAPREYAQPPALRKAALDIAKYTSLQDERPAAEKEADRKAAKQKKTTQAASKVAQKEKKAEERAQSAALKAAAQGQKRSRNTKARANIGGTGVKKLQNLIRATQRPFKRMTMQNISVDGLRKGSADSHEPKEDPCIALMFVLDTLCNATLHSMNALFALVPDVSPDLARFESLYLRNVLLGKQGFVNLVCALSAAANHCRSKAPSRQPAERSDQPIAERDEIEQLVSRRIPSWLVEAFSGKVRDNASLPILALFVLDATFKGPDDRVPIPLPGDLVTLNTDTVTAAGRNLLEDWAPVPDRPPARADTSTEDPVEEAASQLLALCEAIAHGLQHVVGATTEVTLGPLKRDLDSKRAEDQQVDATKDDATKDLDEAVEGKKGGGKPKRKPTGQAGKGRAPAGRNGKKPSPRVQNAQKKLDKAHNALFGTSHPTLGDWQARISASERAGSEKVASRSAKGTAGEREWKVVVLSCLQFLRRRFLRTDLRGVHIDMAALSWVVEPAGYFAHNNLSDFLSPDEKLKLKKRKNKDEDEEGPSTLEILARAMARIEKMADTRCREMRGLQKEGSRAPGPNRATSGADEEDAPRPRTVKPVVGGRGLAIATVNEQLNARASDSRIRIAIPRVHDLPLVEIEVADPTTKVLAGILASKSGFATLRRSVKHVRSVFTAVLPRLSETERRGHINQLGHDFVRLFFRVPTSRRILYDFVCLKPTTIIFYTIDLRQYDDGGLGNITKFGLDPSLGPDSRGTRPWQDVFLDLLRHKKKDGNSPDSPNIADSVKRASFDLIVETIGPRSVQKRRGVVVRPFHGKRAADPPPLPSGPVDRTALRRRPMSGMLTVAKAGAFKFHPDFFPKGGVHPKPLARSGGGGVRPVSTLLTLHGKADAEDDDKGRLARVKADARRAFNPRSGRPVVEVGIDAGERWSVSAVMSTGDKDKVVFTSLNSKNRLARTVAESKVRSKLEPETSHARLKAVDEACEEASIDNPESTYSFERDAPQILRLAALAHVSPQNDFLTRREVERRKQEAQKSAAAVVESLVPPRLVRSKVVSESPDEPGSDFANTTDPRFRGARRRKQTVPVLLGTGSISSRAVGFGTGSASVQAFLDAFKARADLDVILFCVPENYSSQVCSQCAHAMVYAVPEFGLPNKPIYRLLCCINCSAIMHRNKVGAKNVVVIAHGLARTGVNIRRPELSELLGNGKRISTGKPTKELTGAVWKEEHPDKRFGRAVPIDVETFDRLIAELPSRKSGEGNKTCEGVDDKDDDDGDDGDDSRPGFDDAYVPQARRSASSHRPCVRAPPSRCPEQGRSTEAATAERCPGSSRKRIGDNDERGEGRPAEDPPNAKRPRPNRALPAPTLNASRNPPGIEAFVLPMDRVRSIEPTARGPGGGKTEGKGSCLFISIAQQLVRSDADVVPAATALRYDLAHNFLPDNWDRPRFVELALYFNGLDDEDEKIAKIARSTTWGIDFDVLCLSVIIGRPIAVFYVDRSKDGPPELHRRLFFPLEGLKSDHAWATTYIAPDLVSDTNRPLVIYHHEGHYMATVQEFERMPGSDCVAESLTPKARLFDPGDFQAVAPAWSGVKVFPKARDLAPEFVTDDYFDEEAKSFDPSEHAGDSSDPNDNDNDGSLDQDDVAHPSKRMHNDIDGPRKRPRGPRQVIGVDQTGCPAKGSVPSSHMPSRRGTGPWKANLALMAALERDSRRGSIPRGRIQGLVEARPDNDTDDNDSSSSGVVDRLADSLRLAKARRLWSPARPVTSLAPIHSNAAAKDHALVKRPEGPRQPTERSNLKENDRGNGTGARAIAAKSGSEAPDRQRSARRSRPDLAEGEQLQSGMIGWVQVLDIVNLGKEKVIDYVLFPGKSRYAKLEIMSHALSENLVEIRRPPMETLGVLDRPLRTELDVAVEQAQEEDFVASLLRRGLDKRAEEDAEEEDGARSTSRLEPRPSTVSLVDNDRPVDGSRSKSATRGIKVIELDDTDEDVVVVDPAPVEGARRPSPPSEAITMSVSTLAEALSILETCPEDEKRLGVQEALEYLKTIMAKVQEVIATKGKRVRRGASADGSSGRGGVVKIKEGVTGGRGEDRRGDGDNLSEPASPPPKKRLRRRAPLSG